jgi:hypothetical protein
MNTEKHYEIVYASDYPEFFYSEDDCVVPEHEPIGVDVWKEPTFKDFGRGRIKEVKLELLEGIYWNPPFEEDAE